jgi:hypothetical protein
MMSHNNASEIRAAIIKAWPKIPDTFSGWMVWDKVNRLLPHLDVYQDTILHTMRWMNRRGLIRYECTSRQNSLYKKLN